MRIDFNIAQTEMGKFRTSCEAAIRNVGAGTKAATEYAAWEIMSDSLDQVPIDTGTLISSAYLGVSRRADIKSYRYGAVLGYGDPERLAVSVNLGPVEWAMPPTNRVNPKNGFQASTYAAKVHEDLDMRHPNGGKAKFLEDPVRNWASGKFARTAMTYWKTAIETINRGHFYTRYVAGNRHRRGYWKDALSKAPRIENHYRPTQQGTGVQHGGKVVYKGED